MMRGSKAANEPVQTSSLLPVLVYPTVSVVVGLLIHASCGRATWGPAAPHPYCYTDILPLYAGRGLAKDAFPYVQAPFEYPVLTGLFAYGSALLSNSAGGFFLVNALSLGICAIWTSLLLHRMTGHRFRYFALAPTLVLYAVLNWDLLAVALATLGTYGFLRRRDGSSGIALGLGAAAKVYPGFLVFPLALERLRRGERERAVRLVGAAVAAWAIVDLPLALVAFDRWSGFFRFSVSRPPTWGTLWSVGCRALWGTTWCPDVDDINRLSLLAFAAVAGLVWWASVRRASSYPRWMLGMPLIVAFLLTNKVYSPQYSMWLLPWFALVLPDLRTFLAFEVADVLVFLTEFSAQGARFGLDPFPRWTLDVAVIVRAAVLLSILVRFVRDAGSGALSARSVEILARLGMAQERQKA